MNFSISTLESNTDGGVIVAHWRVSKSVDEHIATSYGTCSFTPDASAEGYTAYDALTEDVVVGWVKDSLDTESLEASLDANLAEQANPSVIVGKPW